MNILKWLITPLYVSRVNPHDLEEEIERLEHNQAIMQEYLIGLCRLLFIQPERLTEEMENTQANNEYIAHMYESHTQATQKN